MPANRAAAIGLLCAGAIGFAAMAVQAAAQTGGGPLMAAYNNSGQRLFQALATKPGNIVLSPYSIGTAMAMTLAAARGDNAAEMAKVLDLELSREQVNDASAAVIASLNAASSAPFELRVANAVMLTKRGDAISEAYVATLREKYAAEVFRGANLATVNGWVREKTNGKIDLILDQLDPLTALVLIDAVYFKAPWQTAFKAAATTPEPFHLLNGQATVPTMHISDDFPLVERPGYRAIRLPYAGGRMAMVVVLPDNDVADSVRRLDAEELPSLIAALRGPTSPVDVSLPRFHANFRASLEEPFAKLGMHRAFDVQTADFSGMTGEPQSQVPLAVGRIEHRAVIDVTEQGTEAAAATGVVIAPTAMKPQPSKTFRVDRPFLFAIVDDETAAILFEGRIVDPR